MGTVVAMGLYDSFFLEKLLWEKVKGYMEYKVI
jgi:hypothetical protein